MASFRTQALLLLAALDGAYAIGMRGHLNNFNFRDDLSSCKAGFGLSGFSKSLPNVLFVGDSVTDQSCNLGTEQALTGIAKPFVVASGRGHPAWKAGTSGSVVNCLPVFLNNTEKFDLIIFNWGLHDVHCGLYKEVKSDEYIVNIEKIYFELKKHLKDDGKMIFQTTTPVPKGADHGRDNGDVVKLNELAKKLWAKYSDVQVYDLYQDIVEQCNQEHPDKCYPKDCSCSLHKHKFEIHYTEEANAEFIGPRVADTIKRALGSH